MISDLSHLVASLKLAVRVKGRGVSEPSIWSPWINEPERGYVELKGLGPVPTDALDWVEINPVENRYQGRLVAPKAIDHSVEVRDFFDRRSITFLCLETGVRVDLGKLV